MIMSTLLQQFAIQQGLAVLVVFKHTIQMEGDGYITVTIG